MDVNEQKQNQNIMKIFATFHRFSRLVNIVRRNNISILNFWEIQFQATKGQMHEWKFDDKWKLL